MRNFKNPMKGTMPETGIKSKGSKVWLIVPIILCLWVGGQIAYGMILGTIVVLGLMFTVEQFPGFWALSTSKWGRLIVALGTGYLTHRLFGGSDAIVVLTATAWSIVLKAAILTFEGTRINAAKAAKIAGARMVRVEVVE